MNAAAPSLLTSLQHSAAMAHLGATLMQMVWEAALVGAGLALMQPWLRRRSAAARYAWATAALFSLPLLFAATWLALRGRDAFTLNWAWPAADGRRLELWLPYLAALWALGVIAYGLYGLGGWVLLQRTRRRVVEAVPEPWRQALTRLHRHMGLGRPAAIALSAGVDGPCVMGWRRPLILLPLSAATALPLDQIEALLAHELAHIRRHDYAVNLLQRAVEALFFYHPAVWWISRQVTEEREQCCDDEAIAACGDPLRYARALVELDAWRTRLALAASGGSLPRRVRRILARRPLPVRGGARFGLAMAALAAVSALVLAPKPPHPRPAAPSVARVNPLRHLVAERRPLLPPPGPKTAARLQPLAPRLQPKSAARVARLRRELRPDGPAPAPPALAEKARLVLTWEPAGTACAPELELEQQLLPSGMVWIGVRSVMHCEPVMRPVAVWVLTT